MVLLRLVENVSCRTSMQDCMAAGGPLKLLNLCVLSDDSLCGTYSLVLKASVLSFG